MSTEKYFLAKMLLLFFCLSTFKVFAQKEVEVIVGPRQEEKPSCNERFIAKGENYITLAFERKGSFPSKTASINTYDTTLKLQKSNLFLGNLKEGAVIDERYRYEKVINLKKKTILLFSRYDDDSKTNFLYAQCISKNGQLIDSLRQISAVKLNKEDIKSNKVQISIGNVAERFVYDWPSKYGRFDVVISSDSSRVIIINITDFSAVRNKLEYTLLDADFVELKHDKVEIPIGRYCDRYALSNEGKLFTCGRIKKRYCVVVVDTQHQNEIAQLTIDLDSNYVINYKHAGFVTNSTTNIAFMAFYTSFKNLFSSESKKENVLGLLCVRINPTGNQIELQKTISFDSVWSEKYAKERPNDPDPGLYHNFTFRHIFANPDGSLTLVTEDIHKYNPSYSSYAYSSSNKAGIEVFLVTGDLFVINVDTSGDVKWLTTIKKRQILSEESTEYNSFAIARKHQQLYFIFNGTNNEPTRDTPQLVTLDKDGNKKAENLLNTTTEDLILMINNAATMQRDELIFFAQVKKQKQLVRIKIK